MADELYRPGLEGVIAGETAICQLEGGLKYWGYDVGELAANAKFDEVAYLLLHGELPNRAELAAFTERLAVASKLPSAIVEMVRLIPPSVPTMDVLRTGASALAHWDPDAADNSHAANLRKAERLTAQLPVLMAARHRLRAGQQPIAADPRRGLAENLIWMLTGSEPSPQAVRAMDVSLVLYAEHDFNASTFTARVIASTLSDLHSAIVGAIGALKGPLHGGANERALEVLNEIGSLANADKWTRDALARKVRIMGFGHRVYKDGDPRAAIIRPIVAEMARATGHEELEQTADVVERIVREEKGLLPNVDWPSARLYFYLGLPMDLYTPLFVVSRVTGWSAHVIEQLDHNRLIRPLSRYAGPAARAWVPLESR